MLQKKILVPLELSGKNLKSVHYALALAERIKAHVYILQHDDGAPPVNPVVLYMGEALSDLINSARLAGLNISHHITHNALKEEIVELVKTEGIDLLVFGAEDDVNTRLLEQVKPLVSSLIFQVKEKNRIQASKGGNGSK